MRRVIIIGGTSGIGRGLAVKFLQNGNIVGVTGRRGELLENLKNVENSGNGWKNGQIFISQFDVTSDNAIDSLSKLIGDMGGVDTIIYCSGYGHQNVELDQYVEDQGVAVNVTAFTRFADFSVKYFSDRMEGQFVVISSIVAIRPMGMCPAYSATKRYQLHYMKALENTVRLRSERMRFTTIMPGFICTDFISGRNYPMTMSCEYGVKKIYNAIGKRKRVAIIGLRWKVVVALWRLLPDFIWLRVKM